MGMYGEAQKIGFYEDALYEMHKVIFQTDKCIDTDSHRLWARAFYVLSF